MNGPEHRIDDLGMMIAVLDGEQSAFELGQLLLAFLKEGLPDAFQMIQDRLPLAMASFGRMTFGRCNGFGRRPPIPPRPDKCGVRRSRA
jgi:hypothetical protein